MNEYLVPANSLDSESDVEQKVIYPLLTKSEPFGLGYQKTDIQTKQSLRKIEIDKGSKKKVNYFPDYLISVNTIPSIVIEAKRPHEDLVSAFREASLYAAEINRFYERQINPCTLIIACDGLKLTAGFWDRAEPIFDSLSVEEWVSTNDTFSNFCKIFCKSTLYKQTELTKSLIRKNIRFKRPTNLIRSVQTQNEQTHSSFGQTISIQYQYLFNPTTEAEKTNIVKNAYVSVHKNAHHLTSIEKTIKKKLPPSLGEVTEIGQNTNPYEITRKFSEPHKLNGQVLILIGSVGSGKSTFTTYLKEVALDSQVSKQLFWTILDLNNAPVNSDEIYKWIKKNLIKQIKEYYNNIDFDSLEIVKKVYSSEINKFDKTARLLISEQQYNEKLFDKITTLLQDDDLTLQSLIKEYVNGYGKEFIVALDNCDKRSESEQLLMFQVANWLKDSINSIVFLPLRDSTYDRYRSEKPLDTVIKDLTFRITPPTLEQVIYARFKYASRLSKDNNDREFHTPNNMKISFPARDELNYLKSILNSLFQNKFFKNLLTGLAGRDVRKGIEFFTDFCKSGYISEDIIVRIKHNNGDYKIQNHIISRVLLRGTRVYYSDADSKIKNLFHSEPNDTIPNPFTRVCILKWLNNSYRKKGPSGAIGYHSSEDIADTLSMLGFERARIEDEITTLVKYKLILNESQDSDNFKNDELITISSSGIVHLSLLKNFEYLSTISEDIWFENDEIATKIKNNITGNQHLSYQTSLEHSELLIEYLNNYFIKYFEKYYKITENSEMLRPFDYNNLIEKLNSLKSESVAASTEVTLSKEVHDARITGIKDYYIFVKILPNFGFGFIHNSFLPDDFHNLFKVGQDVKIKILRYNNNHQRYEVELIDE